MNPEKVQPEQQFTIHPIKWASEQYHRKKKIFQHDIKPSYPIEKTKEFPENRTQNLQSLAQATKIKIKDIAQEFNHKKNKLSQNGQRLYYFLKQKIPQFKKNQILDTQSEAKDTKDKDKAQEFYHCREKNEILKNYILIIYAIEKMKIFTEKQFLPPDQKILIQSLILSNETFEKKINYQKALLIGGFGVGKSTIFQKTVKTPNQVQNDFQQSLIQKLTFTLIDSPPFDLDQSIIQKEKLISQFSEFLDKEKADISTFFLLIKYDRIDVMKRSFYSIIKYFKKYRSKVGVIITFWDLRVKEQENDIKEKLQNFFFMCKIQLIGFLEQSTDPEIIQNMLTKGLTGQKGIDLQNTIFEIQQNTGQQDMIQILQKQIQQDGVLRTVLQDPNLYIRLWFPQNQQQK